MKNKLLCLFLILFVSIINGQNEKPEREGFELILAIDSIQFYQQNVPKSPYFVKPNEIIQIFPSENVFVEVEHKRGKIISMKTVKENLNPEKTIEIEFYQKKENRKHSMTMLKAKNPFKKYQLEYSAFMYIVGNDKMLPTSIMPVRPGLFGIEIWNDILITIALSEWKLIKQ